MTRYFIMMIAVCICCMGLSVECLGSEDVPVEQKTMLIINSYNESAPWSQSFTQPINNKLSQYPNVHLEMINLNSAKICDQKKYDEVTDRIFQSFAENKPNYVIMIGNFGFTLRDRIKEEWGDVPMLLISRIDRYAPLEYYFAGYTGSCDWDELPEIADIRYDYNMTMIETPDFCRESIEFMMHVIKDIKKIVYISDNVFANRSFDLRIRKFLHSKYPSMEYEWLQASDSTVYKYQDYMLNKHEGVGLLISTWDNMEHENDMLSLSGANLHLIASAANPVFSLRDSYLSIGVLGGVYHDLDASSEALTEVINKMLDDGDMRRLPLYLFDQPVPRINHHRMLSLGFKEKDFPEDTVYILRAPSMWSVYKGAIISGAIILLLIIVAVIVYMSIQGKRITLLKTHASFIKNMPWAYSKAKILYDKKGRIYDIEYMLPDMNSAFRRLIEENLIPGTEYKIFPYDFIAEKASDLVRTLQPVSFTYHFERTDTYYEILLCRINPKPLKNGEHPKYIDIFANEITKRIKAQHRLSTAMDALDITLNVARIIPWKWRVDKQKIYYEGFRTLRHLGEPIEDKDVVREHHSISESEYINAVDPADRARIAALFADFRKGQRTHAHTEFKVSIMRGGRMRTDWVEVNAAVTETNADGTPKMVLGSILIITQRKRQEMALISAKEKASESDRMKSAFLANMSHEIRTPLNAIVGFSSLLGSTNDPDEKAKHISIIQHNNDLLLHLINDVLDLAKIESNTMQLQNVATDLNEQMRSLYDTVRLRIAKGVVFNMVLGAEECNFMTDPNRLSQIFINLLTNAAKFTTKGSITFGYEINDDEIEFFVQDTGIGISKENQKKLFQRFSKLNDFVQGTGLGLSICKSFVEKMGGQIGVKSRGEGKGCTFWFTLPYIKAEKTQVLEITEGTIIERPMQDTGNITLLVAEDNDSNYKLFESILSKHYTLIRAKNGVEAVEMYRTYKPHLILMDIRMPEKDGFEATKEIRDISQTVPIIAVTAHAFVTDKDKILHSGFNGYVAKPINAKELLAMVKTQLNKRFFVF